MPLDANSTIAAAPRTDAQARPFARAWPLIACAIGLALLVWPIARVANPMLADYPNHLARLFVAANLADIPALARHYIARDVFYPYLPMDLIIGALRAIVGLEPAGKAFLVVSMLMPVAGTMALARALHGRISLWPLVSALFTYNLLLAWGFTTYLFSLGLALFAFACWIATEEWPWPPRIAVFSALSIAIFCSHPFAFSAYGLLFGAWEIGRAGAWSWPALRRVTTRLCLAGLQAVPVLVIAMQIPRADMGNDATVFGAPASRLLATLSPVLFAVDAAELAVLAMLLIAGVAAWKMELLTFDRRMAWPVGLLGVASLLMPQTLAGIYLVHMRLPLLFVLLLIAACRPRPQADRTAALAVAAALAVLSLRVAVAADRLAEADRNVAELRAAAAALEPGARILPTISSQKIGRLPAYRYWHAAAYLTIDRAAYYPLLFSFFNIDVVPELKRSSAPATSPVEFAILLTPEGEPERVKLRPGQVGYWRDWRRTFDYVFDLDNGVPASAIPSELSVVRRGAIFTLYRIAR
ncbi:MAG TPA: hypothetical protein VHM01_08530 [Alphaproteobacteria bacterium]|nr:hypothetical protein [Alphaproteobacteria bacterium]